MQTPLHHCQLVVPASRITAYLDVPAEQIRRFLKSLVGDSQIGQLEQRFGEVRIRVQHLPKKSLGCCMIALALLDVSQIE